MHSNSDRDGGDVTKGAIGYSAFAAFAEYSPFTTALALVKRLSYNSSDVPSSAK